MSSYLFITPKGEITYSDKVTFGDMKRSDNGQFQIVSLSTPKPTQYIKGDWYGINHWKHK